MANVAVLGAGAWGTAMACALSTRHRVVLYARDPRQAQRMRESGANERYLPQVRLPSGLIVVDDFDAAVRHADGGLVIVAAPTRALGDLCARLAAAQAGGALLWLCKGFEEERHALGHEIVARGFPAIVERSGPLSGPSFALEVAQGLPTALTVAGSPAFCDLVTSVLHSGPLRIYSSPDVIGVEVGGTVKNVLAIATGISDALKLGHNARAALITRGLAEMTRLGLALGARAETFMGLAGVGDLILTATGDLSRNRQVGLGLGQGRSIADIVDQLGHVAEGVRSAPAVLGRARTSGVPMPITEAVCSVLTGSVTPRSALEQLLARDPKPESVSA
ncbi:MAG TPA: NAD(P)H-dependent glycerol-3-phosphate dehydrogenase [Burkholderiaceae bacterium]|nr:NAD(P)H-dependent glycerol-3-phosphate dehydrogenase [Burkholderiaceae bacterium]